MKSITIKVLMVLGIIFVILNLVRLIDGRDSKYQTSEYQWQGDYLEDLIEELCCWEGIDYEGNWIFGCPKWDCRGATYTNFRNAGGCLKSFLFTSEMIEKLDPGQKAVIIWTGLMYCDKCKYPVGYDWEISSYDHEDLVSNRNKVGSQCLPGTKRAIINNN